MTHSLGGFEVASGGIRAKSTDVSTPAIAATADGVGFGGAVLAVSAGRSPSSESFRLLQGTVARREGGGRDGKDGDTGTIPGTY